MARSDRGATAGPAEEQRRNTSIQWLSILEWAGRTRRPNHLPSTVFNRPSSRSILIAACAFVALLSLWLRAGFPVVAIGPSGLDDALFLRVARSLLAGEWLGTYDNATLAKGMFYPLFIAIAFVVELPLKTAEQLLYLAASAWMCRFVARRSGSRALAAVLFAALALNPVMWHAFMARVIREGLYVTLTLLLLGLCTAVLFDDPQASARKRALRAAGLGLVAGAFWLTREEGPWIVPSLATCMVVWLLAGTCASPAAAAGRPCGQRLRFLLVAVLSALLAFLGALAVVKLANWRAYGVFETNEFHSSSFQRGYGALARIRHAEWRRYIVFPDDARRKAYAHSKAARELETYLDGESGARWRAIGCEQTNTTPCPEILSGWFMWALRDAVAHAGHYGSARDAARFYERLADEIDEACNAGRIDCLPERRTLAPPFRMEYLGDMLAPARQLSQFVFRMGEGGVGSVPSIGSMDQLAEFSALTGGRLSPAVMPAVVSGWAVYDGPLLDLAFHDRRGAPVRSSVESFPAPDVAKLYPRSTAVRFRIRSACLPADCTLRLRSRDAALDIPIAPGAAPASGGLRVYLDSIQEVPESKLVGKREELQRAVAAPIARAYAAVFPALSIVAAAGLLAVALHRPLRRRHGPLLALAAASGVAVVVRIALLAYLDATSIPSANGSYAMPVSPLLVVFVVLGLWLGWCRVRELWRRGAARAAGDRNIPELK